MSESIASTSTLLPPRRLAWWNVFPFWHEAILALLLLGTLLVAGYLEPAFVRWPTRVESAGEAWPLALMALPMTLIVITGGIDLSIGAIAALSAVVLGMAVRAGVPPVAAVGLSLLTGTLAGAVNGTLIAWLRVHPLIVTLATMAAFRGIALSVAGGETIQGFPPGYRQTVRGQLLGLPYPLVGILILAIATGLFLSVTAYGRFIYAMGHNPTAARFSGVPVQRIRFALFTFSGLCAGMAAVLLTSRYSQAKADFATGLELDVITAVVLGGVSIFGGRGHVVGVLLGVLLIHLSQKFVQWRWYRTELNALVVGALLIGSVLINSLTKRRRRSIN